MTENNGSTNWPKTGARIRPDLKERMRKVAYEQRLSLNMALNLLIEEALDNRDRRAPA
jgi:predicted HicB family RNase H-like nuclease